MKYSQFLVYAAKRDGNGYAPYGSAFGFSCARDAVEWLRVHCFGIYLIYSRVDDGYILYGKYTTKDDKLFLSMNKCYLAV